MSKLVYLNGEWVAEDKASIHFRDLAFQRGYGAFDFFRLVGNRPLFLDDHLDRFYFSANALHLKLNFSKDELKKIIGQLIERNNLPDTGIRLSITGGYSGDGFTIGKPNLLISQHSITSPLKSQQQSGIVLTAFPFQRQLPHIKSIDYLMAVWLQPFRIEKGADDILYHQNGLITECPRSNFFLLTKDEKLVTPKESVLAGVTRAKVLQLAMKDFAVEERPVSLEEIKTAKEAFITSTSKKILPVKRIDDHTFPNRKVGHRLLQLFCQTHNC